MTLLRRSLLAGAAVLGLAVVALLAGLAAIQTDPGRSWLAATLSRLLSTPDSQVSISGIRGAVPSDMRIARIAVADASGAWLEVGNAALTLRLRDLIQRRLTVELAAAEKVSLLRSPASSAAPPRPSEPVSLPTLPVALVLDRVSVDELHIGAPLLGEAATLRVAGHGKLLRDEATAALEVQRLDAAGTMQLDFRLTEDRTLALHLDAAEPSGRMLQHLLGHPDELPLTVAVHGDGPLETWRGEIRAEAGAARLDAAVTMTEGDGLRVVADGTAAAHPLLPQPLQELLPRSIPFAVTGRLTDDRIALEALSLDAGAAQLQASGALSRANDGITGRAELQVGDLRPIGAVIEQPLAGRATAVLTVDGTPEQPRLELALQVNDLESMVHADQLLATLRAARDGRGWSVQGAGETSGLTQRGVPGLPDVLAWTLRGTIDDTTRIGVERFTVQARETELAATGMIDLAGTPSGRGTLDLTTDDLSRWRDLLVLPVAGRLSLQVDLAVAEGGATANIVGQAADLSTGDARLDALLGPTVDMQAFLKRGPTGAIALEGLRVAGAHLVAAGNGTTRADLSTLDGRLEIDAPRLAVLSDSLGTRLEGVARMEANLTGALEKPEARIELAGRDLQFDGHGLDRLAATIALSDVLAPRGTLAATVKSGALDAQANAAFEREGDAVKISQISLRAPGSELTGALTVRTDRPAVAGTLTARAGDLSPWSALAGTALAGSADARIMLAEKDGQRIDIDGSLRDLRMADLKAQAESVRVEAHLGDVLARPTGRAQLEASNVTLPDLRFDRLRFDGRSAAPGVFALSLDTSGVLRPATHAQPLRLSARGEASLAPQRQLRLTRLTGRAGVHDIASRAPLTATATPDGFRIEGLDLGIGEGRVVGSASREAARIAMQLQIRNLPLSIVHLAAPDQDVTGRVDGTMRLAGTAAQPDGQAQLTLRDVRIAAAGDLPPLSATALGTWKSERFDVVGQITAPDGTRLDLRGVLPVRLNADTLMPAVVPDGALRASAKGDGRVESWAALLPLGEDRISGQYTIDLSVDGTPANPAPQGRLTISSGRYINFAAGTEISDVAAEVAGNGTRFVVTRLSGKDGSNGTLTGSGSIDFAAGTALDLRARFTGFGFMRRDDLTASGDGELHLAGTMQATTLSGRLRVDRTEIRIPERLPPSIAPLPVVEVNSRTGEVLTTPEEPTGSSAIALAVDVEIPARMFVRGRGLDSEWRGNIHVSGSTAAPQLTGSLKTVRGDFSLLGKRFVLSDSTITFTGEEHIDPQLSIRAEHRTAAIAAQAVITGTASAPSIGLTSQPELPQDEVLARVLFGRSVTEMTPAQGLELAQAAATLAGRGGPGILDRVRTATGLDRLDISSRQPGAAGDASGTAVTAGRYVTDRVFVGVEQGFKADSTRPKVEVEITPNLSVESSVGDSSAGVGVNWKWDY